MYTDVFTIGTALVRGESYALADALTDYSYINASSSTGIDVHLARCLSGLGPSGDDNGALGGWYFSGNKIPNEIESDWCSSAIVLPISGSRTAGIINIHQCRQFSTTAEGVYTCTIMDSSLISQSIRLGIYFSGRSKLLNLCNVATFPSLNHLSSLYPDAPVIDTSYLSTVTVNVGDTLTLSCTSRGSPPDTFTWRKDNDPTVVQSTSITAVDYTSTSAVFRADYSIDSITTSDRGTYTCTVTNPIGSDSTTITVKVIGKLLT